MENEYQRDQNLNGELGGEPQRDQNLNGELGGEPQRDLGAEQGTEKKGLFERAKELFQKPSERHDQDVTQSDVPQRDEDLAGRSWQGDAGAYEQDQGVKQRPSQGDVTQQQNINQEPLQGGIPQQDQDVSGMGQRDVYERDQDLNQGQGPLAGRDRDVTQNRDVSQAPWSGQQFDNQPEENFSTEPTKQTESGFDLIRERDDEPRSAGSTGATGVTGNEPYTQRGTQGDITENRPPDVERRPDDLIDKAKDKLQGFFGNPDDPSPER